MQSGLTYAHRTLFEEKKMKFNLTLWKVLVISANPCPVLAVILYSAYSLLPDSQLCHDDLQLADANKLTSVIFVDKALH